eukprot:scaffold648755_cov41-Prasinocladus_malaysianus.AAC.1
MTGLSDGTVSVEETKLPEGHMTAFTTVPVAHTFIMFDQARGHTGCQGTRGKLHQHGRFPVC